MPEGSTSQPTSPAKTDVKTLSTLSDSPRFLLTVAGYTFRVNRLGINEDGEAVVETTSEQPEDSPREVLPQDTAYVKDGELFARVDEWDDDLEEIVNTRWEFAGVVQSSSLIVGDSVQANNVDGVSG